MYEHFATSNLKKRLRQQWSQKSTQDNPPQFGNDQWDLKQGDISECRNMKQKVRQIYGSRRVMTMTRMNEKNNKITNRMKSNTKINLQVERLNQNKKQNQQNHSIQKKQNRIKQQPNPSIQCQTLIQQNTKCKNLFASELKPYRQAQLSQQSQPQPQTKPQNFTLPTQISTLLSQALLQNNQSMQKMNESVMNRLLTIIQNNQQSMRNSASMSMGYSRCSHINKHHHEGQAIGSLSHSLNQSNHPEFEETMLRQIKNKNEEKQSARRQEIVFNNMMETSKLRSEEKDEKKREKDDEILENKNQTAKMNDKRKEREFNYKRPKICTVKHQLSNAENENISCERNQIIDKNGSILHQSPIQTAKNCSSPRTSSQNSNTNLNSTQKIQLFSENKTQIQYSQLAQPLISTSVQLKTKFSNTVPIPTIMEICLPTSDTRNCSKAKDRPYRLNKAVLIEPTHNHPTPILTSEKITSFQQRKPVYLQIASDDKETSGFGGMSLAQAFKKRIGKLPSKAERMENSKINQIQSSTPKISPHKIKSNKQNNHKTLVLDIKTLNKSESCFITPKSRQPSEQLLNRLVGGSKVKVSKKEMYCLTKKNYEKLPEVQDRKKNEMKRQLELDRLQRIKQYQKSIRASKSTIISNN